MPKLNKTIVDNAATPEKGDHWVWDSEVPGFGVRVQASGRKTFVVRYRNQHGTARKMTIARCCDLTPDKAREKARKVFGQVADGRDPAVERQEAREAPTIQDLRDRYQREWAEPFKKPRSAKEDDGTWRRYILPRWAQRKVAEIDKADVLKLQGELVQTPSAANQVVALLGKAFNLAEEWKWRPQNSNPCYRLKKYKTRQKDLVLAPDQFSAVDRACDELVAEQDIPLAMAALVRLWLVTGCRNSEIRTAERRWVDAHRQLLLLPDSKVGQRPIQLPDIAMEIIAELDAVYGKDRRWLIPGRKPGCCLASPWKPWKRIARRAGVPEESTPHTLRHTVGSTGHEAGLTQKQIQGQLGHKQMSTTERYIHGRGSEKAKVAQKVAEVITVNWKTRRREEEPAAA
jgi:integrase